MDSFDVQEFLLTTTGGSESILFDTDKIFDKNDKSVLADPNNSTQQSLYYSINDDTMSNRLVDDLQRMERTLTEVTEEESSSTTTDMSSVIQNHNNNTNLDLLTTKDEEFFQQNLLKQPLSTLMFPNHRSQCSTPKLEVPAVHHQKTATTPPGPPKIISDVILTPSMTIPDLIMPLTTLLQKIEKKKTKTVTIVTEEEEKETKAENKENEPEKPQIPSNPMRKSLKPRSTMDTGSNPAQKPANTRKSMIPPTKAVKTESTTAIAKDLPPKPSMMAARKSTRMSVVPTTFKTARFTIGSSGSGRRSGKLNSPTVMKVNNKLGTVTKSSRMTMTGAKPGPSTAITNKPTNSSSSSTVEEPKQNQDKLIDGSDQKRKRMSRIPSYPGKSGEMVMGATGISLPVRPMFACQICKKSFHLKGTLNIHMKVHQTEAGSSAAVKSASVHFKCSYCEKDFEKEIGLRNHMEKYCEKVPLAEKRKLNVSHNRTRTTSAEGGAIRDRSKRQDKSTSSVGSSISEKGETSSKEAMGNNNKKTKSNNFVKEEKEKRDKIQMPYPASGQSPRKPIKSIIHPHSGIKFNANKPIKCFHCKITFKQYVDFHAHVELMHPQPVGSPVAEGKAVEGERDIKEEGEELEVAEDV